MFLQRLASGLVFLGGGTLSRAGIAVESWPLLALGLMAAALGLWHFLLGGAPREGRSPAEGEAAGAEPAEPDPLPGR